MLFWSLPLQIPVSVLIEFFLLIWFTFYYLFSSFVHLYWSLNIVYNEQWEMRESFLFGFAHFPEHWKLSFTWTLGWGQFIQNSPRAESSGSQAAALIRLITPVISPSSRILCHHCGLHLVSTLTELGSSFRHF